MGEELCLVGAVTSVNGPDAPLELVPLSEKLCEGGHPVR